MNKIFFPKLIVFGLLIILGSSFFALPAKAESDLLLETTKACNIQYSGDNCIAELKLTNNTGKVLDGKAFLHIDYQGACGDGFFDGEGITAKFSAGGEHYLDFSGWKDGTTTVSGFNIAKDETQPRLKIETVPNLCPGKYTFTLTLKGFAEGEQYPTLPVVVGGGGGGYTILLNPTVPTTDNGQVTATPGEGGITTLGNPDGGGVKLVIPAGAVEADTIFTITPVTMGSLTLPSAKRGLFVVDGFAYRITAMRDSQFVTTFPKPLVFTIAYTDQQIAGFKQNSLNLYTFHQGNWEIVNSHLDPIQRTITSSISHLSLFALLGEKIPQEKTLEITPQVAGESTVVTPSKETSGSTLNPSNKQEGGTPSSNEKPAGLSEGNPPQTKVAPGVAVAGSAPTGFKGFLAAVGSAWQNVNKTAFFSLWAIILAIILILIGIKIWRKRKSS